jgi:hypothetical protein
MMLDVCAAQHIQQLAARLCKARTLLPPAHCTHWRNTLPPHPGSAPASSPASTSNAQELFQCALTPHCAACGSRRPHSTNTFGLTGASSAGVVSLADVPRVRRLARKHLVVPRERRPLQQLRYAPVGAPPVACKQSTFEPARIARGARAPASCMPRLALLKRRHAVVGPHPTRRPASTSRAAH